MHVLQVASVQREVVQEWARVVRITAVVQYLTSAARVTQTGKGRTAADRTALEPRIAIVEVRIQTLHGFMSLLLSTYSLFAQLFCSFNVSLNVEYLLCLNSFVITLCRMFIISL